MADRVLTFRITLPGVAASSLRVVAFTCTERIGEPFSARIVLESHVAVDGTKLLGKDASLKVVATGGRAGDLERAWHGVVMGVSVEDIREGQWEVEIDLGAKLALLGLGSDHRIFTKKKVPQIIDEVLEKAGLPKTVQRLADAHDPPERHLVQYRESDLEFVQRLCGEEGLGLLVHDTPAKAELELFDDSTKLPPIEGDDTLLDRDASAGREDSVFDVAMRRRLASDQVMLRDYDPEHPADDLSEKAQAPKATGREVYAHPGGFRVHPHGKRLAQRTLERLRTPTIALEGRSDCPRLHPGRTFHVEAHPRREVNGSHLLVAVEHRGEVTADAITYENTFEAQPAKHPWRPPRPRAPWPSLHNAFVTAPGGQEQHADDLGRVNVRFPWDRSNIRDDKSSGPLRVGQLPLGGSMVLPREGFEVMVDYELGDLDRPLVTGHLYNGEQRAPYALPGGNTRSSVQSATLSGGPGANELRFEDASGGEEIFINASKDYTISVENEAKIQIGNQETVQVGSNNTLSVGTDYGAKVGGARSLTCASQSVNVQGAFSEGVGGSLTTSIGGARMVKAGGDFAETCKSTLDRTVGGLQSVTAIAGYQRKVKTSSTVSVGGAMVETAGGSKGTQIGGSYTETIGAVKMIKAKMMQVSCGAAYALTCASQTVKCGGGRIDKAKGAVAVTAGGPMKVKAASIAISATSKLVLRGGSCTIELSSDGSVKISAPNVTVKGVKDLTQVNHSSN